MEYIIFYFAVAWVLAAVVGRAIWKAGKPWLPIARVLVASFAAALFAAPGIAVGHGVAPVPVLLELLGQPTLYPRFIATSLAVTWLVTLLIFCIVGWLTKFR